MKTMMAVTGGLTSRGLPECSEARFRERGALTIPQNGVEAEIGFGNEKPWVLAALRVS